MAGIPALFEPLRLGGIALANRIAVSPMCQYRAENGAANVVAVRNVEVMTAMNGLRAVEAPGEVTSSPSSRTVPLVDTRQVANPSAGGRREISPSVISLASARAFEPWPAM